MMNKVIEDRDTGMLTYEGDTFKIHLQRYTDPSRLNAARNAAIYLGKSDRDNVRRPLSILKKGHVAEVFRGEMAEFEFVGVSKEVYDHLITYTTRNLRVTGGNRALTSDDYTMPSDHMADEEAVKVGIEQSMDSYQRLLLHERPQVARSSMPVAAKMNPFVFQFNLLSLMQAVFPQRVFMKGAQGNTVKVVQGMFELVREMDYELWDVAYDVFGTPAIEWQEVRRKLKKMTAKELYKKIEDYCPDEPAEEVLRDLFGSTKSMW